MSKEQERIEQVLAVLAEREVPAFGFEIDPKTGFPDGAPDSIDPELEQFRLVGFIHFFVFAMRTNESPAEQPNTTDRFYFALLPEDGPLQLRFMMAPKMDELPPEGNQHWGKWRRTQVPLEDLAEFICKRTAKGYKVLGEISPQTMTVGITIASNPEAESKR